jgi:hypothetical protein
MIATNIFSIDRDDEFFQFDFSIYGENGEKRKKTEGKRLINGGKTVENGGWVSGCLVVWCLVVWWSGVWCLVSRSMSAH